MLQKLYRQIQFAFPFAIVTFWLLSFPMSGPVLGDAATSSALYAFLLPHIVSLFTLGLFLPEKNFNRFTRWGGVVALLGTGVYLVAPGFVAAAMALSGIGGAFLMVRAGAVLNATGRPVVPACIGLVGANMLLALVVAAPLSPTVLGWLVASALTAAFIPDVPSVSRGGIRSMFAVVPFILVFHLTCGILYAFLLPRYSAAAWFPGFEMFFYCIAVAAAALLYRPGRMMTLLVGLLLTVLAWVLLYPMTPVGTNLGMWSIQGAAGFVDLFLVAFFLSRSNPVQRFALGCATICSGILVGGLVSNLLSASPATILFFGSVVLSLAAMALLLFTRRDPGGDDRSELPPSLKFLLSKREREVVLNLVNGATYREISQRMGISESTVKTYMGRIFEKTRTGGKKELMCSFFRDSA